MQIASDVSTAAYSDARRVALANRLTDAAMRLDRVVETLTPDPANPDKPTLQWGNDLGIFEQLDKASNLLDKGRDGVSEIFTRRQAGKLIDRLSKDVQNIAALRDAALAIDEGVALGPVMPAPEFSKNELNQITRAAADARDAIRLLMPAS